MERTDFTAEIVRAEHVLDDVCVHCAARATAFCVICSQKTSYSETVFVLWCVVNLCVLCVCAHYCCVINTYYFI